MVCVCWKKKYYYVIYIFIGFFFKLIYVEIIHISLWKTVSQTCSVWNRSPDSWGWKDYFQLGKQCPSWHQQLSSALVITLKHNCTVVIFIAAPPKEYFLRSIQKCSAKREHTTKCRKLWNVLYILGHFAPEYQESKQCMATVLHKGLLTSQHLQIYYLQARITVISGINCGFFAYLL